MRRAVSRFVATFVSPILAIVCITAGLAGRFQTRCGASGIGRVVPTGRVPQDAVQGLLIRLVLPVEGQLQRLLRPV